MKHLSKTFSIRSVITLVFLCAMQTILWAQDSTSSTMSSTKSVTTSTQTENWYSSPWVWLVGAAVFILLLIALTRGSSSKRTDNSSTDRVTVTKTVSRDTDGDTV
ncbi:MAG: hypothetical protein ABIN57_04145 [Chitinophagaceae bacterium]